MARGDETRRGGLAVGCYPVIKRIDSDSCFDANKAKTTLRHYVESHDGLDRRSGRRVDKR